MALKPILGPNCSNRQGKFGGTFDEAERGEMYEREMVVKPIKISHDEPGQCMTGGQRKVWNHPTKLFNILEQSRIMRLRHVALREAILHANVSGYKKLALASHRSM